MDRWRSIWFFCNITFIAPTCFVVFCRLVYFVFFELQVLLDSGEYEEAEKVYDIALQRGTCRNPTILLHKGILKLQRDSDLKGAASLMKEAIAIDPKFESAYENLATIEVQTYVLLEEICGDSHKKSLRICVFFINRLLSRIYIHIYWYSTSYYSYLNPYTLEVIPLYRLLS